MKIKIWHIKRYVLEEFSIEAKSKEEAIELLYKQGGNPYNVTVLKEIIRKITKTSNLPEGKD